MESKSVDHGVRVVDGSAEPPPANPPPYPGPPPRPHPQVYQPQPGYTAPGVYPHPQTVIYPPGTVHATVIPGTVLITPGIGAQPTPYRCPSCNQQIVTKVVSNSTTKTHLFALLLCVLGCWPCVCLPYCMDDCMSTDHYCTNCNSYIGSYQK